MTVREFRKLSRYIMQEDLMQPMLSIQECMKIAADLKIDIKVSNEKKLEAVS